MAINPDRIIAAHSKLAEDPHDVDSWLLLIKHAQCRLNNVILNYFPPFFILGVLTKPEKLMSSLFKHFLRVVDIGKPTLNKR